MFLGKFIGTFTIAVATSIAITITTAMSFTFTPTVTVTTTTAVTVTTTTTVTVTTTTTLTVTKHTNKLMRKFARMTSEMKLWQATDLYNRCNVRRSLSVLSSDGSLLCSSKMSAKCVSITAVTA